MTTEPITANQHTKQKETTKMDFFLFEKKKKRKII